VIPLPYLLKTPLANHYGQILANDPCLFIDDNGKGYIYFNGGGDYLVAEMADDLLSVKGDMYKMNMEGNKPKREDPCVFSKETKFIIIQCPKKIEFLLIIWLTRLKDLGNTKALSWTKKEPVTIIILL